MSQLISGLPASVPTQPTDLMIIEQGSGSKKITILQLIGTFVGNAWSLLTTGANNVVPVYAGLAANGIGAGAYANIDICMTPKGTGALMASTPDNIAVGGNKRGTYAVDWQMQRTLASQVASGVNSTICGGLNNLSGGIGGTIGGGNGNQSGTGQYASVGGGQLNVIASAAINGARIGGGRNNQITVAGDDSVVAGGQANLITNVSEPGNVSGGTNNLLNGNSSFIPGGRDASTRVARSTWAWSGGMFAVQGDAQIREGIYRKSTANATPTNMRLDGSGSDQSSVLLCMPINSAYSFVIELVAKSSANKAAFFEIRGLLQIGATISTAALVGVPSGAAAALFQDAALAGIAVAIAANTSFGCIDITVTGIAATNIKWVARMRTVEVVG